MSRFIRNPAATCFRLISPWDKDARDARVGAFCRNARVSSTVLLEIKYFLATFSTILFQLIHKPHTLENHR